MASNHEYEVGRIVDVANWVRGTMDGEGNDDDIVLLGSLAGAAMAGTASHRLSSNDGGGADVLGGGGVMGRSRSDGASPARISAYVAVGYTFGHVASVAFCRHFHHVASLVTIPRLFVMGERDKFTSVGRLEGMARKMRGGEGDGNDGNDGIVVDVRIVPDVGHFELESPRYDGCVASTVLDWLDEIFS
jgi:hypothetical protein